MGLWVRTGNGGSDPDVFIRELGIVILTGASFSILSYYDGYQFFPGQFTPEILSNSQELFDLVRAGDLEASSNGTTNDIDGGKYGPITPLALSLSTHTPGVDFSGTRLIVPIVDNFDSLRDPPVVGEIVFSSGDGYFGVYDGSTWGTIDNSIARYGGATGEPGQVIMTIDGYTVVAGTPIIGGENGWIHNLEGILLACG